MEQTTLQHWLRRSSAVDTVRVQRVPSPESFSTSFFLGLTPAGALSYFVTRVTDSSHQQW